jgi:hypothetical protein
MTKILISNLIVLFILYFVQGIPFGFQSRYLPLILRLNGNSLSELGFMKLLLIPWILKIFLSKYLIDSYFTKRIWLLISLFLLSIWSFLASLFYTNLILLAIIMFCLNLFSVAQDICVDWFAINLLDKNNLGIGNTIQVAAFKLGTLFSGGLLVYLIDYIQIENAFKLISLIYLICLLSLLKYTFLIVSNEINNKQDMDVDKDKEKEIEGVYCLKDLFKVPHTIWLCTFLIVYKLGEQSSLNMSPLYLIDNKIKSSVIGLWTGIYGQTSSILGSFLAGILLKKLNLTWNTNELLHFIVKLRIIPICLITSLILYQNYYELELNSIILCKLIFLKLIVIE